MAVRDLLTRLRERRAGTDTAAGGTDTAAGAAQAEARAALTDTASGGTDTAAGAAQAEARAALTDTASGGGDLATRGLTYLASRNRWGNIRGLGKPAAGAAEVPAAAPGKPAEAGATVPADTAAAPDEEDNGGRRPMLTPEAGARDIIDLARGAE